MSVRRPFSPPLHSAAHYTRKHLHAGQRAAPPNHAEWADAKRVRSISTVRSVRFEPLAHRQVAVIIANTPTMLAAKAASTTIPIVFVSADDPVRLGLVASFNRPGGNATGVYFLIAALEAKRAEVVHELVPKATMIAVLVDPNFPSAETQSRDMEEAARSLGLKLLVLKTGSERDFDTAFATLVRERAGALVVAASGLFFFRRGQLITLAARHAVPRSIHG